MFSSATGREQHYHWYGHAERVVLAEAGRCSDLIYFWPAYGYVEFGPPNAEGLQEVIDTSFHNLLDPRDNNADVILWWDATSSAQTPSS